MKKLHDVLKKSQTPVDIIKFIVPFKNSHRSLFMLTTCDDGSLIINAGGYFQQGNWRWGHFDIPPGRIGKSNVTMTRSTGSKKNRRTRSEVDVS